MAGEYVQRVVNALGIKIDRVRAQRAWALCPYHDDHDASWFIRVGRDRRGQHHCFSCKNGGGILDLVMHVRQLDMDAARAWIAGVMEGEILGDVEELAPGAALEMTSGILAGVQASFHMPKEVRFKPIAMWPTPMRDYILARNVTSVQIRRYSIGYAVDGRLAGRVVLPTMAIADTFSSYMGRAISEDDRKRYLYPRAKENPDLDVMFGEHRWPTADRKRHTIVVTEGGFDALAVERALLAANARFYATAALNGSDVRAVHVSKLSTFGAVVILTDNDPAGHHAAEELQAALGRHTTLSRAVLPAGTDANKTDPNELCRRIVSAA